MWTVQRRRDTLLFLAVMGSVGTLTFIVAGSPRVAGPLSAADFRRTLLETVGAWQLTALYLWIWRRQWHRALVASCFGVALLCWTAFAPDRLMRPSWEMLFTAMYLGIPFILMFRFWHWVRR